MEQTLELLTRPGIYHPMFCAGRHAPGQDKWLDETCELVEAFVEDLALLGCPLNDEALAMVSLSVHLLADFLFDMHGADVAWDKLECERYMARLEAEMQPVMSLVPATAGQCYRFMALTGRINRTRGMEISATLFAFSERLLDTDPTFNRAERRRAKRLSRRDKKRMN